MPVGKFDHFVRCAVSSQAKLTLALCASDRVDSKALAAVTIFLVVASAVLVLGRFSALLDCATHAIRMLEARVMMALETRIIVRFMLPPWSGYIKLKARLVEKLLA
jgi:hypothetical protein